MYPRLAARELIKQAGKGQQLRLKGVILRKIDANRGKRFGKKLDRMLFIRQKNMRINIKKKFQNLKI